MFVIKTVRPQSVYTSQVLTTQFTVHQSSGDECVTMVWKSLPL